MICNFDHFKIKLLQMSYRSADGKRAAFEKTILGRRREGRKEGRKERCEPKRNGQWPALRMTSTACFRKLTELQ